VVVVGSGFECASDRDTGYEGRFEMELNKEQVDFAIAAMAKYMDIFDGAKGRFPNYADVCHSYLLRWLLHGHEPFPYVPPKFYNRPCYELECGGSVILDKPHSEIDVVMDHDNRFEKMEASQQYQSRYRFKPNNDVYIVRTLDEKRNSITKESFIPVD